MIFKTYSTKETKKLAADLAQEVVKSKLQKHACVFALEGELGVGKTTFIQGFAKALKIKRRITSPTFVLIKNYKLQTTPVVKQGSLRGTANYKLLIHVDAFRLKDWRELVPLGIKEMFASPKNIILIEWAERVRPILPRKYIKIHIDHLGKTSRKITITFPKSLFQ